MGKVGMSGQVRTDSARGSDEYRAGCARVMAQVPAGAAVGSRG